ncbi:putative acetyltransferase [Rhodovulum iodosum]|uniref:Acetyltransferase n=1 Tax=Rhodovulum iodosum TaxID=68291 RepID=A0ABV3XNF3_9RHOB|nr:GNAT family N-acetyltransferase [Rhodovulum robiginosum]RSK34749.1 GNAT family N-acetyltransferase [Rhodovulum robiginosum]
MGRSSLSPARRGHLIGVRLRAARPGDGPACHAVFHAAVHQGAAAFYSAEERAAWAPTADAPPDWEAQLLSGLTLIAERRGRIAGFMTMGADGHIDFAYVAPRFMGRGVSDALCGALESRARAAGLSLLTTEASHLARSFFLRRGWRETARQTVIRRGVALMNFRMEFQLTADRDPTC